MNINRGHTTAVRVRITRRIEMRTDPWGNRRFAGSAVLTEEDQRAIYPDLATVMQRTVPGDGPPDMREGEEYLLTGQWRGEYCFEFERAKRTG